jgi:hypothetical protein
MFLKQRNRSIDGGSVDNLTLFPGKLKQRSDIEVAGRVLNYADK